jgi:hypothetical protein
MRLEQESNYSIVSSADRTNRCYLENTSKPMQKTNINPAIYQQFLESASNAGDKGQAQYFTPMPWAKALGMALPYFRPVIIDLNCGAGHLLKGVERGSTNHLLGCDIDPGGETTNVTDVRRITADVCKLLPLFRAVNFGGECFVLNPPWDLHLYRENLAGLANSELATVCAAFAAHDGRTGKDTIDSTVATLCLALDLCNIGGEGYIIGNESTLQRLILGPDAPHKALAVHVWAHVVINGNITDPNHGAQCTSTFQTGELYFARDHDSGILGNTLGNQHGAGHISSLKETIPIAKDADPEPTALNIIEAVTPTEHVDPLFADLPLWQQAA